MDGQHSKGSWNLESKAIYSTHSIHKGLQTSANTHRGAASWEPEREGSPEVAQLPWGPGQWASLMVTVRTPNDFCRLSVYENKQTSTRPKRRVGPRLGMGKGKRPKNTTQFRLVMGAQRTLSKESKAPTGFHWSKNKHLLKRKPQGQPKAREKKVQDWVNKGGSLASEPQTKKMFFFQNVWCCYNT